MMRCKISVDESANNAPKIDAVADKETRQTEPSTLPGISSRCLLITASQYYVICEYLSLAKSEESFKEI